MQEILDEIIQDRKVLRKRSAGRIVVWTILSCALLAVIIRAIILLF